MEKLFRIISHTVKISRLSVSQKIIAKKTKCGNFENKLRNFLFVFLKFRIFFANMLLFFVKQINAKFRGNQQKSRHCHFFLSQNSIWFLKFRKKVCKIRIEIFAFFRESSRSLETLLKMQVSFSMIQLEVDTPVIFYFPRRMCGCAFTNVESQTLYNISIQANLSNL